MVEERTTDERTTHAATTNEQTKGQAKGRLSRRGFLGGTAAGAAAIPLTGTLGGVAEAQARTDPSRADADNLVELTLNVNGEARILTVDHRASLLDALRSSGLTGTKKGCDAGHCGACTVHVNGERRLSCLTLAQRHRADEITTIEGLAPGAEVPADLHPVQRAFLERDGYQCGACTSGQVMSAVACIDEGHANTRAEIREYMSGNICRCGAYPHILDAVEQARDEMAAGQGVEL